MNTYTPTTPDGRAPGADIDFTTGDGLRQVIEELTVYEAWSTSPVAAELMVYATTKYTPVANAWHRDPSDAAVEAFFAMRTPTTRRARDPWAVVTRSVALSIAAETMGERFLTSQDTARRPKKRPETDPVRAGHYEGYLYDILPPQPSSPGGEAGVDRVVRTAAAFLVSTGWAPRSVEQALDFIAYRITGLSSREAAAETVTGDLHIATRLGYDREKWAALVQLTVGKTPRRAETEMGLFARVLLGDTIGDLLADTRLVAAARQASMAGRSS